MLFYRIFRYFSNSLPSSQYMAKREEKERHLVVRLVRKHFPDTMVCRLATMLEGVEEQERFAELAAATETGK